jgi:hypothetical protein
VDVEAGHFQDVAVLDLVDAVAEVLELGADGLVGPQAQVKVARERGADSVGVQVVGVLVGDQDGGGAREGGGWLAPAAWVDDQGGAVFLQA